MRRQVLSKVRGVSVLLLAALVFSYCNKEPEDPPKPATKTTPVILQGATWLSHFNNDIKPYWVMSEAKGVPQGNFPTYRTMDGHTNTTDTNRYPRMLSRQTFVYAMGYMMTGDAALLQLAKDGCDYLMTYAKDNVNGGWYEMLDTSGNQSGSGPKYAQDTAYTTMGLGAYFFVTRNTNIEKEVLYTRDLIFSDYWDAANKRVKDGLSFDMTTEVDYDSDGGYELVALLDQLNAYMVLVQPVLTSSARRSQFLDDMETLCDALTNTFWEDGIFWGVHNVRTYNTRHVDFGHTLKSYWMIYMTDKRLSDRPFKDFVLDNVYYWIDLAYDDSYGMWADKMLSQTTIYNSERSYWVYAECDQITATLNLLDNRYTNVMKKTMTNWMKFVDKDYSCRELYPGLNTTGGKYYPWPVYDTWKCWSWKNGFHSTEHALIMYILGKQLEKKTVDLYFAVPAAEISTFIAKPYLFNGTVVSRTDMGAITIDGETLRKVKVTFKDIN